jgi:hypothetical protein
MVLVTFAGTKVTRVRANARFKSIRRATTKNLLLESVLGRPGVCRQTLAMRERRGDPAECIGTVPGNHDQARALLEIIDTER